MHLVQVPLYCQMEQHSYQGETDLLSPVLRVLVQLEEGVETFYSCWQEWESAQVSGLLHRLEHFLVVQWHS